MFWFVFFYGVACALAGILYYALASVGCACLYTYNYRTKLRGLYSLEESPSADFLVHCCCMTCDLCQEYRELKNRGTDPSIGSLPRPFPFKFHTHSCVEYMNKGCCNLDWFPYGPDPEYLGVETFIIPVNYWVGVQVQVLVTIANIHLHT